MGKCWWKKTIYLQEKGKLLIDKKNKLVLINSRAYDLFYKNKFIKRESTFVYCFCNF